MRRYIVISTGRALLTLLGVSVIVFCLARLSGNPLDTMLPDEATEEDRAYVAALWGLARPVHEQYVIFLGNALRGDFGTSFKWPNYTATGLVLERLPASLQLGFWGLALSVTVAVPMGVLSAVKRGTWIDTAAKLVALFGQSVPAFWLAIILIWVFAVGLGWLPTSGRGGPAHMVMPVVVLATFGIAAFVRLLRSSMLEVLDSEYIKLARLKGLPEHQVIWKHALKNAAIAPLTFFGGIVVHLLTGSTVVETIFSWPGLGLLALEATTARDYQVVQALALFGAAHFILMNLVVDLLYAYIDPRVRLGR